VTDQVAAGILAERRREYTASLDRFDKAIADVERLIEAGRPCPRRGPDRRRRLAARAAAASRAGRRCSQGRCRCCPRRRRRRTAGRSPRTAARSVTRICVVDGCPDDAVRRSRCVRHAREQEAARPRTSARNGWEWGRRRARRLRAHPVCERCGLRPSMIGHHLGDVADDDNVAAVCEQCHRELHHHGWKTG
jgi:hypothetical protein